MTNFLWLLAMVAGGLLVILLIILTVNAYLGKKTEKAISEENDVEDEELESHIAGGIDVGPSLRTLRQQQQILEQLILDCDPDDGKRLMLLECWELFLDVEYELIKQQKMTENLDKELEKFLPLTDYVDFAQSMEVILKKIAAQKAMAQNIVKEIEHKTAVIEAKTEATNQMSRKVDAIRQEIAKEDELDKSLLDLRLQLANLWKLENRIKDKLANNITRGETDEPVSEEYQSALEAFLDDAALGDFITPIQEEYQSKIEQLKSMANFQKGIIHDLKLALKEASEKGTPKASMGFEVAIARLEKTFTEKRNILRKLEAKLDSLQLVRHNLTLDIEKHDALIQEKGEELKQQEESSEQSKKGDMQAILQQQHASVGNIEALYDNAPFMKESEQLIQDQEAKIKKIKRLVNESELLVELLEQDLEAEQKRQEELTLKLAEAETNQTSDDENREIERLQLANQKLQSDIKHMKSQLMKRLLTPTDSQQDDLDWADKLEELDKKIERVKTDYAQMEEKYLSALLM